jgi:hypothetical protein
MKKIIIGAALLFTGLFAKAQNGLENVIVEKYYVSNAADAAGSSGTLPVGSVTYRIFVDMLPGYNFQALYGVNGANPHTLLIQSSTAFFNNEDYGGTTPNASAANVRKNSALLDSYFSVGGGANGKIAVLKTDDTDGSPGNAQGILQNNDATAGAPINIGTTTNTTAKDGLISGSPVSVTFVGIPNTGNGDLGIFDATSQVGGLFSTDNGSVAALGGATGADPATNRVLVGQFTTDGVFHFELNIQIGTPTGGVQNYVASNPVGAEITVPFLTGTYGAANIPPTVSITAPANGASFLTGASVAIAATAADADGSVTQVEFKVDGVSVGVDNTAPYTATYTAVNGSHCITAIATDNNGATTTTACTNITVASNPPPVVNITNPANGASFITGSSIVIDATATDNGAVTQVEFFVDGVSVGVDATSPYSATYVGVAGSHCLTARATDNLGATTTTPCTNITVANNPPPVVSITAPVNGANFIAGSAISIAANATDNGAVTQVEFFVDGVSVGVDLTSPYTASYVGVLGAHCITATATDNLGATATTPCRNINVVSSILPYEVVNTNNTCNGTTFCVPIAAVAAVNNVIGYDLVVQYDAAKVTPTGNVTVYGDLVTPSWVDAINSIDAANGLMNISLFFNGSAPATAKFSGTGNLICVEFTKTAAFNYIDTVSFTVPTLQESYFTGVQSQFVNDGNFSTYKDTTYNGKLSFWADNSPIQYDAANPAAHLITNIYGTDAACANQSVDAVQPDLNGDFSFNTSNGLNISIQKDIDGATDVQPVINGFDALLGRKVLINDLTFIPNVYQAIALDVNADGVISAGDISQINQRAVLIIPEFRQAWNYNAQGQSNGQPSKDWLFVDTATVTTNPAYTISSTYPLNDGIGFSKASVPVVSFCLPINVTDLATCPVITSSTFKGILLGDINGNFATVVPNNLFRQTAGERVTFDLSKAEVTEGFISIPVAVNSMVDVNALDFAMQFNADKLVFNSASDVTGKMETLAHLNANDKTLRFTSFSLQAYAQNTHVVSVKFATNNAAAVSENDLSNVVAYINGDQVTAEVVARNGVSSLTASGNNVSVFPNPAIDKLNVQVIENAAIQLMDAAGRVVMMQPNVIANETFEINTANLAAGVYTLKVNAETFVTAKKVIIKK